MSSLMDPGASAGATAHPLGGWRTPKVSQKVAMAIVEDLITRDLQAGERLPPETEMMDRYKVSRASLREGLRLLETYGVITIRQGQRGGPEISAQDPGDLARTLSLFFRLSAATYGDVFNARLLIEPVMSRIAAEQQNPELIKSLKAQIELEKTTPEDEYVHASNNFHQLVSGLSGNPVLDILGHALRAFYAERLFRGQAVPDETLTHCRTAHPQIGEAILTGNGPLAQALMTKHMTDLNHIVDQRATWFMHERVTWEI